MARPICYSPMEEANLTLASRRSSSHAAHATQQRSGEVCCQVCRALPSLFALSLKVLCLSLHALQQRQQLFSTQFDRCRCIEVLSIKAPSSARGLLCWC